MIQINHVFISLNFILQITKDKRNIFFFFSNIKLNIMLKGCFCCQIVFNTYLCCMFFTNKFSFKEMSTRVFVGGLTYRVRERDLEKFFRKYGRIKEVAMKNGFAFVVSLKIFAQKLFLFFLQQYGRDKGLCRWASIRHQGKRP